MTAPDKLASREVAFLVVRDVFGPEARTAQAAFDVRARRAGLDARDRGFAAELAYGSIKMRRALDWQLAPYLGGRDKPLTAAIADVLRLGAYQLRFMSGVDDHAAVSETVNLAWRHGHKGTAGLVNAVLRRMLADGPRTAAVEDFKSENDFRGTTYSVPTWVASQFVATYDGRADAALAGVNVAPQHALRVNALRADVATVRDELRERGIAVRDSPFVAESLLVDSGTIGDDPNGRWSVQGEAAAMPVDVLAPEPGETVLELCSGRGNKTVQIAARMGGTGEVISVESDAKKSNVWEGLVERAGVTNAALVRGDACDAAAEIRANAVLLDAPCSGTGIIGRHPEARWRKTPEDGARLALLQGRLLRAAAERTAPGGRLVYSVCSADRREGADLVDAFLAELPAFARAPFPERYAALVVDGDLVVPPGIDGRDGFFVASLRRAGAVNPFAQLETACATAVERAFALAFPSALEPVQIARKLVAAFESGSVPPGRAGRRFVVRISAADHARLGPNLPYLERQWAAMLAGLAERSGRPQRAPDVSTEASAGVAAGTVTIAVEVLPETPHLALRVRRGLPPGAVVPLAATIVVGRDPSCDLTLIDPRASRRHLEIVRDGATLRVHDLGSSNGTLLNGVPVRESEIGLGDVLSLGDTELAIEPDESNETGDA